MATLYLVNTKIDGWIGLPLT